MVNGYTNMFCHCGEGGGDRGGGQLLGLSVCFPEQRNPSKMGYTLKGKDLLLWEQILLFKIRVDPHRKGKKKK